MQAAQRCFCFAFIKNDMTVTYNSNQQIFKLFIKYIQQKAILKSIVKTAKKNAVGVVKMYMKTQKNTVDPN